MARYRFVSVRNSTRQTTVAEQARVAQSMLSRVLGLHLLPPLRLGEGLMLPGATTIDTTFMRYPIDLVFLDESLRVTRVVANMRPWRMVLNGNGGRDCLELPAGAATASGTQVGDEFVFADLAGHQPPLAANR